MGKRFQFEGKSYDVPDDATDAEVLALIEADNAASAPVKASSPQRPSYDRSALGTTLSSMFTGAAPITQNDRVVLEPATDSIVAPGRTFVQPPAVPQARSGGGLRTLGQMAGDYERDAYERSPERMLQRSINPNMSAEERQRRELQFMADQNDVAADGVVIAADNPLTPGVDPVVLRGGAGEVARRTAKFGGSMAGSVETPSGLAAMFAGGSTAPMRMATAGGANMLLDIPTQAGDVLNGTQDRYEPMQTAMAGVLGPLFVGGVEGARALLPRAAPPAPDVRVDVAPNETLDVSAALRGDPIPQGPFDPNFYGPPPTAAPPAPVTPQGYVPPRSPVGVRLNEYPDVQTPSLVPPDSLPVGPRQQALPAPERAPRRYPDIPDISRDRLAANSNVAEVGNSRTGAEGTPQPKSQDPIFWRGPPMGEDPAFDTTNNNRRPPPEVVVDNTKAAPDVNEQGRRDLSTLSNADLEAEIARRQQAAKSWKQEYGVSVREWKNMTDAQRAEVAARGRQNTDVTPPEQPAPKMPETVKPITVSAQATVRPEMDGPDVPLGNYRAPEPPNPNRDIPLGDTPLEIPGSNPRAVALVDKMPPAERAQLKQRLAATEAQIETVRADPKRKKVLAQLERRADFEREQVRIAERLGTKFDEPAPKASDDTVERLRRSLAQNEEDLALVRSPEGRARLEKAIAQQRKMLAEAEGSAPAPKKPDFDFQRQGAEVVRPTTREGMARPEPKTNADGYLLAADGEPVRGSRDQIIEYLDENKLPARYQPRLDVGVHEGMFVIRDTEAKPVADITATPENPVRADRPPMSNETLRRVTNAEGEPAPGRERVKARKADKTVAQEGGVRSESDRTALLDRGPLQATDDGLRGRANEPVTPLRPVDELRPVDVLGDGVPVRGNDEIIYVGRNELPEEIAARLPQEFDRISQLAEATEAARKAWRKADAVTDNTRAPSRVAELKAAYEKLNGQLNEVLGAAKSAIDVFARDESGSVGGKVDVPAHIRVLEDRVNNTLEKIKQNDTGQRSLRRMLAAARSRGADMTAYQRRMDALVEQRKKLDTKLEFQRGKYDDAMAAHQRMVDSGKTPPWSKTMRRMMEDESGSLNIFNRSARRAAAADPKTREALREAAKSAGDRNREAIVREAAEAMRNATPEKIAKSTASFVQLVRGSDIGALRMYERRYKDVVFTAEIRNAIAEAEADAVVARPRGDDADAIYAAARKAYIEKHRLPDTWDGQPIIRWLGDQVGTDPGSGRVIGQAVEHAAAQRFKQMSNRLENLMDGLTKDERIAVRDYLVSGIHKRTESDKVRSAGERVRSWLNDQLAYMRDAGVNVGSHADYYSRIIDHNAVNKNQKGFLEAATRVYMDSDPNLKVEEAQAKAQAWLDNLLYPANRKVAGFSAVWGGSPDFTKGRALRSIADDLLREFYVKDPLEALPLYAMRTSMLAEQTRRFGVRGARLDAIYDNLRTKLDPADFGYITDHVSSARGMSGGASNQAMKAARGAMSWAQIWGITRMLARTSVYQMAEPINVAMRANQGPLGALKALATQFDQYAKLSKQSREADQLARLIGVAGDSAKQLILDSHTQGLVDNIPRRVASAFFERTFTGPITEAQRVMALRIGDDALRSALDDIVEKGTNAKGAELILGEYGITPENAKSVRKWLNSLDDMPTEKRFEEIAWGTSSEARAWRAALHDFAVKSIMEPTLADTPHFAKSPILQAAYAVTSFAYSFTREARNRVFRQVLRADGDAKSRWQAVAPLVTYLSVYVPVMTLLNQTRQQIFSTQYAKDQGDADRMRAGLSAAGAFGTLDPILNYLSPQTRYAKEPSAMLGPDYLLSLVEDIDRMVSAVPGRPGNSSDTNTAEHKAAKAAYSAVIAPVASAALVTIPGGPVVGAAVGGAVMTGTSSNASNAFADAVVGPSDAAVRREKQRENAAAEDPDIAAIKAERRRLKKEIREGIE